MYDIHYHLIYGVDDGPATLEQSLELAEASIAEGVNYVVATPHANYRYPFQPEINKERLDALMQRLEGRLTLGFGCDFHLSYDNLEDLFRQPSKYTINGKQYLLVEFPDHGIPPAIANTFYQMQCAGVVPILTHPERNPILLANPDLMASWLEVGCLVQITAASLSGQFGSRCQAFAHTLIKKTWVHLVASDAHYMKGRWPRMGEAYQILRDRYGDDLAERLCVRNPRAVVQGEALEFQPEPEYRDGRAQKRWSFSRLFGR
ncbi:MAG: tyrosine-protein phosphatase [Acidobacteriota bacterium]